MNTPDPQTPGMTEEMIARAVADAAYVRETNRDCKACSATGFSGPEHYPCGACSGRGYHTVRRKRTRKQLRSHIEALAAEVRRLQAERAKRLAELHARLSHSIDLEQERDAARAEAKDLQWQLDEVLKERDSDIAESERMATEEARAECERLKAHQAECYVQLRALEKDILDLRDAISSESHDVHHSTKIARETRAALARAVELIHEEVAWQRNAKIRTDWTDEAERFVAEHDRSGK
jgi:DNA repair exonuclease SbcCD ATPase subunit